MSRHPSTSNRQSFSKKPSSTRELMRKPRPRFSVLEALENRRLLSFSVTTTADSGTGSLREAINLANTTPGQDTIKFNIPGGGVQPISLLAALPTISEGVIIDGTTQTGYVAGGAPLIQLIGTGAGAAANGFDITGGDTTIQGLAIDNFGGAGINISGLGNDTILSNYIGITPTGALAANGEGVVVQSDGNKIGIPAAGNVISGNSLNGVRVTGSTAAADHNTISNNFIGTDPTGEIAIGNGKGVTLDNVSNTLVNGNLISGNGADGVRILNSSVGFNTVMANNIGVNIAGNHTLGNLGNGVTIDHSSGILIGGSRANGNVISASLGDGVLLNQSSLVTIAGNNIGTDSTGTKVVSATDTFGNAANGVELAGGSHDNTVGGTTAEFRNLIDGGAGNGVLISTGASANNLIVGNYIGVDESGTKSLASDGNSVNVASPGATISGNVISSGGGAGLFLNAAATVQGNLIGTQSDGVTALIGLPNTNDGIDIFASGSLIGGAPGFGNVIAFNGGNGISVFSGTQNSIRANSIHDNVVMGIDLNGDGFQPNSPANTPGTGANNSLNHPVLTTAVISSCATTVSGSFVAPGQGTYTIELFSSTVPPDNTISGQGRTYLGSVSVTTDANGNGTFTATVTPVPGGQGYVTATATDSSGNTSEFSSTVMVTIGAAEAARTTTSLTTSNASVIFGTSVTFTASVMHPTGATPGGTITFKEVLADNSTVNLGAPVAFSGAPVSITISTLSIGSHNVIAVYSGDTNYLPSSSSPVAETVRSDKATISGNTFRDTTGDGLSSDDGRMAGVTVKLFRDVNNNGSLDCGDGAAVAQAVTDSTGAYNFGNLAAGRYFVQEVTPTGFIRTAPALSSYYTVNSTAGILYSGKDFDNYMMCNDRQYVSGISYNVNGRNCWIPDLRGHIHEGDTVKVRFSVATGHTATLALVSYTAPGSSFDATKASLQSVYQFATGTFTPGCHTMTVTIPKCYFQVDFVCGDYIDHFGPAGSNVFYSAQNRLISADNGGVHAQLLLGTQDRSVLNT